MIPAALLSFALSSAAFAQTTRITFEVSSDHEATWTSAANISPGDQAIVRLRVQLIDPGTSIIGLSAMTYQPTLTNWLPASGDQINLVGEHRDFPPYEDTTFGRLFPFTSVGMATGSASGRLTAFEEPGHLLRIAGANAISPTTNLSWGVISSQLTRQLGGTNVAPGTDVVIFKYTITPADTGQERTLLTGMPLDWVQNRRATWFRTDTGTNSFLSTLNEADIVNATIHVIPAPATLFLVLAILPRRRRT